MKTLTFSDAIQKMQHYSNMLALNLIRFTLIYKPTEKEITLVAVENAHGMKAILPNTDLRLDSRQNTVGEIKLQWQ